MTDAGEHGDSGELADRRHPPDDRELALVVVLEALGRLACDQVQDLPRDVRAALDRGLRKLRKVLRSDRDVARGEDPGQPLDLQILTDADAVALIERKAPLADLLVRRDTGRPDREVGREDGAVREPHRVGAHLVDA